MPSVSSVATRQLDHSHPFNWKKRRLSLSIENGSQGRADKAVIRLIIGLKRGVVSAGIGWWEILNYGLQKIKEKMKVRLR